MVNLPIHQSLKATKLATNPCIPLLRELNLDINSHHRLAVAFSGGVDSTALLLATYYCWPNYVTAFHIHHGLQSHADDFLNHTHTLCKSLKIPFFTHHLHLSIKKGESIEARARQARYKALASMAKEHRLNTILLAQHADDQVETVLLALSRGAGLAGLAAMPKHIIRHSVSFIRPLLSLAAKDIRQYLKTTGIPWIEDPMNQDQSFSRVRLRQTILPVLENHFPTFRQTFSRSAQHAWQAQEILHEVAQEDLATVGIPPDIHILHRFSQKRQINLLRSWLVEVGGFAPSYRQMQELIKQILACQTKGHQLSIKIANGFVQKQGSHLVFQQYKS